MSYIERLTLPMCNTAITLWHVVAKSDDWALSSVVSQPGFVSR